MYEVHLNTDRNFEKMLQSVQQFPARANIAAREGMLRAVNLVRTAILQSGRVPYKTGTLRRSITTHIQGDDIYNMRGYIGTNLPYAPVHEFGGVWTFNRNQCFGRPTRPYVVRANYVARHYIGDTFSETLQDIQRVFSEALSKGLRFA